MVRVEGRGDSVGSAQWLYLRVAKGKKVWRASTLVLSARVKAVLFIDSTRADRISHS